MRQHKDFYDINQVNSIPILEVCEQVLNIPIEKRGNNYWCKCRGERTASTIIHPENNTFYDFGGSGKTGDVIEFVSYACDISRYEAMSRIASAFHIPSINPREGMDKTSLTDWEYKQIGLAGDRATKNFTWDFDHTPVERMVELEQKYAIPMNTLRQKYPKIFEKILRQKALPFVYELRNDYYLNVRSMYQLTKAVGNTSLFDPSEFSNQIKTLITAEKILARAAEGTSFKFTPNLAYDPLKDIEKLNNAEIMPSLGDASKTQLQKEAEEKNTQVRYRSMDYTSYLTSGITGNHHMAFLKGDQVIVGYLASDYGKFRPFFDKFNNQKKSGLDEQIKKAEKSNISIDSRPNTCVEPER